ncbi:MAG TPA: uroporphyrinogen-III C-methyltransferase [Thermoanaerobaculia bacterium]|jgi:uroporphyrinogen III methyltransferase/synthase|nr:uroporphyrinogen-III C-methyltransferase [Thermoanaerobaculia bacterium]
MSGIVYLVGAGPGDPGLLTRRAAELLGNADLVVLDALVSKEIVALVSKQIVYVGKRASAHTLPQEQINQLLIDEAKQGKRVVRLKGGDPFVFGRGGEEAEELRAAGVGFEIVPGISSAIAGPAYAGIPVTHREHSTSLTLVTGHESEGTTGIDWETLAKSRGTIVFLMGFGNLPLIVKQLTAHGMTDQRPIAVISKATTPQQRTVTGTLADIETKVEGLPTPALIVVGEVVKLHERLNWFESKPLFGRRIVVTRAREQASELKRLLEESGAQVVQFPTIEIAPPESFESLDRVLVALSDYQWLIFTSTNGVRAFFDRLHEQGKDARALSGVMIAAVGESTAADLRARGLLPDLVPDRFLSTALLPLLEQDQRGIRTAVVRAAEGREELIEELRKRGGEVDLGIAYRAVAVTGDASELRDLDAITFTSASTVDNFFAAFHGQTDAKLVSIGPTTSAALNKHGKEPTAEAAQATVQALHDVVVRLFS